MKTPRLSLFAVALSLATSLAEDLRPGAKSALRALPTHFAEEIVRLSADNGRPNPTRWYVLARNRKEAGPFLKDPLYSITIANGQLSEARRYVDLREILNRRNFVDPSRVRVDSSEAFEITRNALGPAGERMQSASYQLTQPGPQADPIWHIWAYGRFNRYIGMVKLSAKSGDVISTRKAILPIL
jgi:hypothetical protein